MKNFVIILGLIILFSACDFFGYKEKQAIEICQKAKIQYGIDNIFGLWELQLSGLTQESTWLDYANMMAKKNSNKKLDWTATKTDDKDIYLVTFADKDGWGFKWEVSIDQKIVKEVNTNEYLCRKYGISRLDTEDNFQITDIEINTIKLEREISYYSDSKNKKIICIFKASVKNRTGKTLTSAEISGKFQVIFKDKVIEGKSNWESGFKTNISINNPWKPYAKKVFYIKTEGIEKIYLDYEPEYVCFVVNLTAEDPIGFSYNKAIKEYELKKDFKSLKQ